MGIIGKEETKHKCVAHEGKIISLWRKDKMIADK